MCTRHKNLYKKKRKQRWGEIVMKLISNEKKISNQTIISQSIKYNIWIKKKNKAKHNNGISFIYLLNNLFMSKSQFTVLFLYPFDLLFFPPFIFCESKKIMISLFFLSYFQFLHWFSSIRFDDLANIMILGYVLVRVLILTWKNFYV